MKNLLATTLLLLGIFTNSVQAQLAFADISGDESQITIQTDEDLTEKVFFADTESGLFFIDFEALGETPIELTIKQGEAIVLQEDVSDLPENTIFEVNLKLLQVNKSHVLEIKTDMGTLKKDFKLLVASK